MDNVKEGIAERKKTMDFLLINLVGIAHEKLVVMNFTGRETA